MKIKKGTNTLTSLVMTLLLVLGVFYGLYGFMAFGIETAALDTATTSMNETYTGLLVQQTALDDNMDAIKSAVNNVKEAENTAFAVWNGMKGIGSALLLPISLVSVAIETSEYFLLSDNFIPEWFIALLSIAIVALVVFIVLGALKGEARL